MTQWPFNHDQARVAQNGECPSLPWSMSSSCCCSCGPCTPGMGCGELSTLLTMAPGGRSHLSHRAHTKHDSLTHAQLSPDICHIWIGPAVGRFVSPLRPSTAWARINSKPSLPLLGLQKGISPERLRPGNSHELLSLRARTSSWRSDGRRGMASEGEASSQPAPMANTCSCLRACAV